MGKTFDIGLERLTGGASLPISASLHDGKGEDLAAAPEFAAIPGALRGTFFLETFGCQMNDHDSEKVAGVLLARGYRQVESPESASLILYNTCSIREKAAQKVFSGWESFARNRMKAGSSACWAVWRNRKAKIFSNARRG